MIASLSMYARPETSDAINRFWALIRANLIATGIDAPETLAQDEDYMTVWTDPDLVLSQTCGMPFRKFLHGKVNMVVTPDPGLENCPPGYYRSSFVVRKDDPRTSLAEFKDERFAYNEENSQSGFAAPFNHAKAQGFAFSNLVQSGGHAISAKMVAEGDADVAAIDGLTWKFVQRYDSFAANLRVLEWTDPATPCLPLITSLNNDSETVHAAVAKALDALSDADRETLSLKGLVRIPEEDYLAVSNP
ncbi:phosphate/phosphite/phosphonate ABC transporter substrate-binding protein [Cochlodiniinecator piscidefendens]|uniref:phosphate/phosphite/phosphonate ABC transporter substrate-binding protein n=1 Tax=Cochlodiniinecator piscidefendens TaxID=2715756 RepID=UPI00140996A9|nr:PhnD/SsuA/transferrin family substrate-binding protein [Cochlodiniinecator piscidefendens]